MRFLTARTCLLLAALLIAAAPTRAQRATQIAAADGAAGDEFGHSIAVSGGVMVVGAPGDDDRGTDSGSAYVFVRSGQAWVQQAKLTASDGAAGYAFGTSVAISGGTLVIGVPPNRDRDAFSGAAYVFVQSGSTWTQQAKLVTDVSSMFSGSSFGASVGVSGETVVVGDTDYSIFYPATNRAVTTGVVHVFVRSGTSWVRQARLQSPIGGYAGDGSILLFGYSLAFNGQTLVVGCTNARNPSTHVFARNGSGWTDVGYNSVGANSGYGQSVAVSGAHYIAGAPNVTYFRQNNGAAYVYTRDGSARYENSVQLAAPSSGYLGSSVALDGNYAVLGAALSSGPAQLFARSGASWTFLTELAPDAAPEGTSYGSSVALGSDFVVVAASAGPGRVPGSGNATVFANRPFAVPGALAFEPTAVRGSRPLVVTLNALSTPLSVTRVSVSNPAAFAATVPALPFAVGGGTSRPVTVTFTPPSAGAHSAYLVYEHDGPTGRDSVLLTGTGVDTGLAFSPAEVNVGGVATGTTRASSVQAILRGLGSQITVTRVTTSSPALASAVATPFTISTAGTRSVSVPIAFTPTVGGPFSGYVYFEHDGTTGRDSVRVSGSGQYNARLQTFGTQKVGTNFVNVLFRASTSTGASLEIPPDDLARTLSLFRVFDGGQAMSPTAPESFYQIVRLDQDLPYRLRTVLMVDNSTSVSNDLPQIRAAARLVVDNLAPDQELAVYTFSGTTVLWQDFTADRQALYAAIDGITLGGPSTALYTSLLAGLARWQDRFGLTEQGAGRIDVDIERGFLVVLSDGDDTSGGATLAEVLAARGNRRVYAVGYGAVNAGVLQQVGNAGSFTVATAGNLPAAFAQIQAEIANESRSFYWLNYSSPRRAAQTNALQICLSGNTYTGAGACAETTYSSAGFADPISGVYVDRSVRQIYGVGQVDVSQVGVTLTATTVLGLRPPVYAWTTSDAAQLTVAPVAGTNQAVATRVGPVGGMATITVTDTANGFTRTVSTTGVVPGEAGPDVAEFGVRRLYPNPARGQVVVEMALPSATTVRADVMDLLGRRVLRHEAPAAAGVQALSLDMSGLAPGVYVVRVSTDAGTSAHRITVVR